MKKILFPVMLTLCIGSAFAQSGSVTTSDEKGNVEAVTRAQTEAEKSADAFCLRETGSHLRAITKSHNERAVECAGAPGRSYSREDIERTGSISTADALRRLDPSIH
jgi:hypothetical protein